MFRTLLSLAAAVLLVTAVPAAAQSTPSAKAPRSSAKQTSGQVVNLNTATAADFQKLPGIGAKTADRIIDYRKKNGPFKKIEELMNVRGIGEKNFLKLKSQITVATPASEHGADQK
ncbi:MAG: ComEA family DNA-binding protein [Betaproteobacteria bacterium]